MQCYQHGHDVSLDFLEPSPKRPLAFRLGFGLCRIAFRLGCLNRRLDVTKRTNFSWSLWAWDSKPATFEGFLFHGVEVPETGWRDGVHLCATQELFLPKPAERTGDKGIGICRGLRLVAVVVIDGSRLCIV